jgi:hypothetical protein
MVRTSVIEENRSKCKLNAGMCPQNRIITIHEVLNVGSFILVSSESLERESEYAFDCHPICVLPGVRSRRSRLATCVRTFSGGFKTLTISM